MCFLCNSKLRITVSNFLKIFSLFSLYYLLIIPNITDMKSVGGLKWNRTIDLTLIRRALSPSEL